MGKKARSTQGLKKKAERKVDKSQFPPPPPPPEEDIGSLKLLDEPSLAGGSYRVLVNSSEEKDVLLPEEYKYDDGGVADLSMLIDLDDVIMRRRKGDSDYYQQMKQDLLPRMTRGSMANMSRRDQKVSLAQLLFSEDNQTAPPPSPTDPVAAQAAAQAAKEQAANGGNGAGGGGDSASAVQGNQSEVYVEFNPEEEDPKTLQLKAERLSQARAALRLSLILREAASASLSLTEIAKRKLALSGKAGAEEALRCANKAIDIASDGFWDSDEINFESLDNPRIPINYERNATRPGLSHPESLKYIPKRVSTLCLRSAWLQKGNALAAMGKESEAREIYEKLIPSLKNEPRCGRIDWERHSLWINIGNTFSRSGDYDSASEYYNKAQELGNDHLTNKNGSKYDGKAMIASAKRSRAFALKKIGRIDEAKAILKEVIDQSIQDAAEEEAERKKKEAETLKKTKSEDADDIVMVEKSDATSSSDADTAAGK